MPERPLRRPADFASRPPFAQRLIDARLAAKKTQAELADALGVERSYYNRVEKGQHAPVTYIVQIAKQLGGSPSDYVPRPGEEGGVHSDLREEVVALREMVEAILDHLGIELPRAASGGS